MPEVIDGSTATTGEQAMLSALRHYTSSHMARVIEYIDRHPIVRNLLAHIAPQVWRFIPDAELHLDLAVMSDEDDRQNLVVTVITALPVQQALQALKDFERSWWLWHTDEADDRIVITLDYR